MSFQGQMHDTRTQGLFYQVYTSEIITKTNRKTGNFGNQPFRSNFAPQVTATLMMGNTLPQEPNQKEIEVFELHFFTLNTLYWFSW